VNKDDIDALVGEFMRQNGSAVPTPDPVRAPFPEPIPASQLKKVEGGARWVLKGCVARGAVTLLSALWKAGKSTLLSHLLKAVEDDGTFCGLAVSKAKVLYVTEENESLWADRRDAVGFGDNARFQVRPFGSKPTWPQWFAFLEHLKKVREEFPYELLVLDTLSNLWPLRDENEATQMQSVLMPLHAFGPDVAILAVHHLRKGGGDEATGSRGSGALAAFVDVLLELRRYDAMSKTDTRRVLSGYGRYTEVPSEVVLDLTPGGFIAVGTRQETRQRSVASVLASMLPTKPPGVTADDLLTEWPGDGAKPQRDILLGALKAGHERGDYGREGRGVKGSPHRYWMSQGNSNAVYSPIGGDTELGIFNGHAQGEEKEY
jgi:DNA repair protein RadA/Sms